MKLLEAAGVMCSDAACLPQLGHTYMHATHSLSLACFVFLFFSLRRSGGSALVYASAYQYVSVPVFMLACPLCYCPFVKLPVILWLDVCLSPCLWACVSVSVTTSQPVSLTHCFSYWPFLVRMCLVSGQGSMIDSLSCLMNVHLGPSSYLRQIYPGTC